MKTFKQFILEAATYNVPVVSIEKTQVDLDDPNTVNEINKNLSIVLSKDFANIGEGLNAAKKVLTMYGIELPKIDFNHEDKGKEVISIGQYKSSGESHFNVTGPFQEKNEHHNFIFTYELKDGKYDVHAEVHKK
jgi:hypothetical protein